MSVQCSRCGQEWPRDPAFEVPCPTCGVGVGRRCKRPSGHPAQDPHSDRERAAMAAGFLEKCPGETRAAKKDLEQDLFAQAT